MALRRTAGKHAAAEPGNINADSLVSRWGWQAKADLEAAERLGLVGTTDVAQESSKNASEEWKQEARVRTTASGGDDGTDED